MRSVNRRGLLALATLLGLTAAACGGTSSPSIQAEATGVATTPAVDKKKDEAAAKAAVITAKDLPGPGWARSTTATTAKKGGTDQGDSFDCPELGPGYADAPSDSVSRASSAQLERPTPFTNVEGKVVVYPSEEMAKSDVEQVDRDAVKNCLERGFSHEAAKTDEDLGKASVANWTLGKIGDGRAAFDVTLSDVKGTDQEIHLGFAVVRVGRTAAIVVLGALEPLGDDAKAIVSAAVDKLRDNQPES